MVFPCHLLVSGNPGPVLGDEVKVGVLACLELHRPGQPPLEAGINVNSHFLNDSRSENIDIILKVPTNKIIVTVRNRIVIKN